VNSPSQAGVWAMSLVSKLVISSALNSKGWLVGFFHVEKLLYFLARLLIVAVFKLTSVERHHFQLVICSALSPKDWPIGWWASSMLKYYYF
jgi:hypothetical protein